MNEFKLIIKPDEDEDDAAEVYVDGKIGSHSYRFLFDTGAARTSIVFDDYTSTFETIAKNDPSSTLFATSQDDLIQVPSIEIGPISKQYVTLVRKPNSQMGSPSLIGMDLLKDFSCHFLFDEDRIVVNETEQDDADYPFQPLLLDKKFHPYVEVQISEVTANAVWDTGASLTVVDMSFVEKHKDFFHQAGQSIGIDGSGVSVETPMFMMAETVIGNHQFPAQRVAGVDLSHVNANIEIPMDMILGYSLLRKARWLFDFPQQKWAITKQLMGH